MHSLLLDRAAWDLVVDAAGNIAVAAEPYALAQDAASAIQTFKGECYWDTDVGVPYMSEILGKNAPLALLKQALIEAALSVPDVSSAQVFLGALNGRALSGQVQVIPSSGVSAVAAATFSVVNPQGGGG